MQPVPFPPVVASEDDAIRAMFAARKRVFVDLLRWNVPVLAGTYEIDQFDTASARYLIYLAPEAMHRASARLLPTSTPHLLDSLFAHLCEGAVPRGPHVREISRFCLDRRQSAVERREARNVLVSALIDQALIENVRLYTGIAEMGWYEQIADFGWDCAPLGQPCQFAAGWLTGLQIAIGSDTREQVRSRGVYQDPSAVRVLTAGAMDLAA